MLTLAYSHTVLALNLPAFSMNLSSACYIYIYSYAYQTTFSMQANSMISDQAASKGAV